MLQAKLPGEHRKYKGKRKERGRRKNPIAYTQQWLFIAPHTHTLHQSNALCKGKLPHTTKDFTFNSKYGPPSWTTFPARAGKWSGYSWCWHLHSRFPSGTLVPFNSHMLFLGLSEAQTQENFFMCCRSNSALTLRDSPSLPQTYYSCRHKNQMLEEVARECLHKPSGLGRRHRETTSKTALLLLLTDRVNLLAPLQLWKMRAPLPFPHESALRLAKRLWQYATLWSTVDKKLPARARMGARYFIHSCYRLYLSRDTKLPVLWHAPSTAIAGAGALCTAMALSPPALTSLATVRGYQYLHNLPHCAPWGSPPGAQDISVNAFSLPASDPFICRPPELKVQPFCQSHHHLPRECCSEQHNHWSC